MAAMLSAKASMRGAAVAAAAPRRAARAASARLQVSAHCQVPCGIFDDAKQLAKLKEVGDGRGGGARARALVAPAARDRPARTGSPLLRGGRALARERMARLRTES